MTTIVLSEPMEADIEIYRGDSGEFKMQLSENQGTEEEPDYQPIDISDATWLGQIKHKADDTDVITSFDFVLDPDDSDNATMIVSITSDNSALLSKPLHYDIEMNRGGKKATLMTGAILLTKDVSR